MKETAMMYRLLILAAAVVGSLGQAQRNGTCDVTNHQTDVDLLNAVGVWYQVQRVVNTDEEGDCSTTTVGFIGYNGVIINTEVVAGSPGQHVRGGTIQPDLYGIPGRFFVTFDDNVSHDYYLLGTDYNNYALVYSCQNNPDNTKNVWAWLLSRERKFNPTQEMIEAIEAAGAKNPDIQGLNWRITRQDNC